MRFLRHLGAVVLMVAVIVGLGMVWAHASGGGPGTGGASTGGPGAGAIRPPRGFRLSPFNLADTGDLVKTCVIEAVVATAVITVSVARRQHRRKRRAAAGA